MQLISKLTADHRNFYHTLSQLDSMLLGREHRYFSDGRRKETTEIILRIIDRLLADLRKHEETERQLLFPALIRDFPQLQPAIESLEKDHADVHSRIIEFRAMVGGREPALNREIIHALLELFSRIKRHMQKEEREIFSPAAALERDGKELKGVL